MTNNVGQRLLADAEDRSRAVSVYDHLFGAGVESERDVGPPAELLGLPLDGIRQTEIIQHPWPQLSGDPLHRLDGLVDQLAHGCCLLQQRLPFLESPRKPRQVNLKGGQGLTELIMHLARQSGPLVFANGFEKARELAQLLPRSP